MSKKNKQSPANEIAAVEEKQVIATESLTENESVIAEEAVVEATIKAPVEEAKKEKEENKEVQENTPVMEKKIHDKPKKKVSKRQGVIVEAGLASVIVVDLNGNRFRLTGVKGNVGDTVEF